MLLPYNNLYKLIIILVLMDSKEASEPKTEVKEETSSGGSKSWVWFLVVVLIVVVIALAYFINLKNNEILSLKAQLNQTPTNTGTNGLIDALVVYDQGLKTGNVLFFNEAKDNFVGAVIPLSSYGAGKLAEDVISKLDGVNLSSYSKNVAKNGQEWTVIFTCEQNDSTSSVCNSQVKINETDRSYNLVLAQ
jgi:hypothetical protein